MTARARARVCNSLVEEERRNYIAARLEPHCAATLRPGR